VELKRALDHRLTTNGSAEDPFRLSSRFLLTVR